MTTYTTFGPVRGQCGHAHRSREAAVRCLQADDRGCARQRGYGDRAVCVVGGDGRLDDEAGNPVWPPWGRSTGAVQATCRVPEE